MKRIIFLIALILGISLNAQDKNQIKQEALQIIKKINKEYNPKSVNAKIIPELFCKKISCTTCNEKDYDDNFLIENKKINNNIKKFIEFLNFEKLEKSEITFYEENKEYIMGYQLANLNPKQKIDGSQVLISFKIEKLNKKEKGKLKISGIQIIK